MKKPLVAGVVGLVLAGAAALGLQSAYADADNGVNLALGKAVTSSAPCRAAEDASKAVNGSVDGGLADKWCSGAGNPSFLQVDLGKTEVLGKFVVKHAGAGGEPKAWNSRDFSIAVSVDGKQFTTVASKTGNTSNVTTHKVDAVQARYVKLSITQRTSSPNFRAARIYEFEVFSAGVPGPLPSDIQRPPQSPPTTAPTTAPAPTKTADPAPAPSCHSDAKATMTDYIDKHNSKLTREFCNENVAVYYDEALAKLPAAGTAWISPYANDIWKYMKATYGQCEKQQKLVAPIGPGCENFGAPKPALFFLHQDKFGGGRVSFRFDGFSDFRTTIDAGDNGWREDNGVLHDVLAHEACHQVEGASHGIRESPSFGIWADSHWAEFCVYDFYMNTGRKADAERFAGYWIDSSDSSHPEGTKGTFWWRDWFLPLWKDGGGKGAVMERYFALLAANFPTDPDNDGKSLVYSRRMNTGEFVLFMSAAAGKDLSPRAEKAFNSGFKRSEFDKAKKDFPKVTFPGS